MYKFMFCTFAFLAWGFWELSGGADFEPPAPAAQTRVLAQTDVARDTPALRSRLAVSDTTNEAPAAQLTAFEVTESDAPQMTDEEASALSSGIAALGVEIYQPETTSSAVTVAPVEAPQSSGDLREVAGSRVNMRNGPSTSFQVLAQLVQGDVVEVIDSSGDGWVQLRVETTGQVGWMAERLLTAR